MSFAPRDTHEAQVQFALERGVPALIGVLASIRLPYPSRAFDMAHCSRCLIPWGQYGNLIIRFIPWCHIAFLFNLMSAAPLIWGGNHRVSFNLGVLIVFFLGHAMEQMGFTWLKLIAFSGRVATGCFLGRQSTGRNIGEGGREQRKIWRLSSKPLRM